jgi:hypothetical protein
VDYHQLLSDVLKAALIASVPVIMALVTAALGWLKAWIDANVKNVYLQVISNEALEVVSAIMQKTSQPIKDAAVDGKLSDEEKAKIKQIAIDELMARLKGIPAHIFPDLMGRVGHAIEAAIPVAKALQNPQSAPVSK